MAIIILFVIPQRTSPTCSQADEENLSKILNKTAKYCERVKSIALFYVCQEEIRDKANFYKVGSTMRTTPYGQLEQVLSKALTLRRTRTNSYLYDYQLIKRNEEGLSEQRILLKKNGRNKHKENAELEVKFSSGCIIYIPVGFLSRYWQDYFDYEIIGQKRIEKKKATIIKATPKSNNEENRNFAKIWIYEEDGSIIQIEWEPEDYAEKNIETFVGNLETAVVWRVTYGVEKYGVRFPSRQQIQEFLVTEADERYILNETTTVFNNYKFFIVEYEIKNRP